jgi:hypothetical protein
MPTQRQVEIKQELSKCVTYERGDVLRNELKLIAKTYKKLNTDSDYLSFMNEHECTFSEVGKQSENSPYYWCLFTVKSQHVYGDCIEECLDKAINK